MFYDIQLLGRKSSLYAVWSAGITGVKKLHKSRVMAQNVPEIWFASDCTSYFL